MIQHKDRLIKILSLKALESQDIRFLAGSIAIAVTTESSREEIAEFLMPYLHSDNQVRWAICGILAGQTALMRVLREGAQRQ